jgi:ABC-type Na+ efflux pump permease subunit
MKRLFKIVISAFIFGLLPLSILSGQEKKSEQKVKIIVYDGTGTKVVIDTLIKDGIEMKTWENCFYRSLRR